MSFLDFDGLDYLVSKVLEEISKRGVVSFNGRSGIVEPSATDYTPSMVGAVPIERTINGKALDSNITLVPSDIGAQPSGSYVPTSRTINKKALSSNITLSASDLSAVPTSRTINGKALSSDIILSASDISAVPKTRTVNGKALSSDITLTAEDIGISSSASSASISYGSYVGTGTTTKTLNTQSTWKVLCIVSDNFLDSNRDSSMLPFVAVHYNLLKTSYELSSFAYYDYTSKVSRYTVNLEITNSTTITLKEGSSSSYGINAKSVSYRYFFLYT